MHAKERLMDEQEIWKECPLHTSYEVSSFGRVRRKGRSACLKPWRMVRNKGYLMVGLGRCKRCTVHRLVAATFLGLDPSDTRVLVCHRDDNPLNNKVSNLYLGDKSTNQVDFNRLRIEKGERHPNYVHGRYVGLTVQRRGIRSKSVALGREIDNRKTI